MFVKYDIMMCTRNYATETVCAYSTVVHLLFAVKERNHHILY